MGSTFSQSWRGKREMIKYLRNNCAPYRELDHHVGKGHDRDSILYRLLEHTETRSGLCRSLPPRREPAAAS